MGTEMSAARVMGLVRAFRCVGCGGVGVLALDYGIVVAGGGGFGVGGGGDGDGHQDHGDDDDDDAGLLHVRLAERVGRDAAAVAAYAPSLLHQPRRRG